MGGNKQFNDLSVKLAYGDDHPVIKDNRVAAVQTLSGTGEEDAESASYCCVDHGAS